MCAILIALATCAFALGLVAALLAGGATMVPVVVLKLRSASSSTLVESGPLFASAAVVNFVSTQGFQFTASVGH